MIRQKENQKICRHYFLQEEYQLGSVVYKLLCIALRVMGVKSRTRSTKLRLLLQVEAGLEGAPVIAMQGIFYLILTVILFLLSY